MAHGPMDGGEFFCESRVGIDLTRKKAKPVVQIVAGQPMTMAGVDDTRALAQNILDACEAAERDAVRVQQLLDDGIEDLAALSAASKGVRDEPDAG